MKMTMWKYWVVFKKSFKSQMIYRSAMLGSIASTVLSFGIQLCLWYVLLGTSVHNGTSFTDMVIFVIVNALVSTLTRSNISTTIETAVVDGTIAMEIIRPISYKYYLLSNILGEKCIQRCDQCSADCRNRCILPYWCGSSGRALLCFCSAFRRCSACF